MSNFETCQMCRYADEVEATLHAKQDKMGKLIEEGSDAPDTASEAAALLCADCAEVHPATRIIYESCFHQIYYAFALI